MLRKVVSSTSVIEKLLILLVLCFVVKSCNLGECKKVSLTNNELKWVKYYKTEDTLLFVGDDNSIDSFAVTYAGYEYGTCNKFEIGDFQYQYARAKFTVLNNHNYNRSNVYVEFSNEFQENKNIPCKKFFNVFNLSTYDVDKLSFFKTEDIYVNAISKSIQTYKIEAGIKVSKKAKGTIKINSFNWSIEYGLVKYVTELGKNYVFLKKI